MKPPISSSYVQGNQPSWVKTNNNLNSVSNDGVIKPSASINQSGSTGQPFWAKNSGNLAPWAKNNANSG